VEISGGLGCLTSNECFGCDSDHDVNLGIFLWNFSVPIASSFFYEFGTVYTGK